MAQVEVMTGHIGPLCTGHTQDRLALPDSRRESWKKPPATTASSRALGGDAVPPLEHFLTLRGWLLHPPTPEAWWLGVESLEPAQLGSNSSPAIC